MNKVAQGSSTTVTQGDAPARREVVLIVDDSRDALEVLERNLSAHGYEVVLASSAVEAVTILGQRHVDVVLTDLKMPHVSGLDLVRHVRENHRDVEVMMVTGYPSVEVAVQALKAGAEDFLAKPYTEQELIAAVQRTFAKLHSRRALERPRALPQVLPGLVGESPAMRSVFAAMERAAATTGPVLFIGESGVGKEYLARVVHYAGPRADAPFLTAGLSSIPAERVCGEVFGVPAQRELPGRPGLVHGAGGGSLFLDEVGDATPELQQQLTTFIEERQATLPGGSSHVRVFASTARNLTQLVRNGAFREDLFYELSAVTIEVPPLRQRGEDVLLLARHFVKRIAREEGRPVPELTDRVISALQEYAWPGNVRELESTLRRMVVMSVSDTVDVPDLPTRMRFSAAREWTVQRSLEDVEAEHIRAVVNAVGGNQTRAAEILGIDRKTLHQKLQRMPGIR